MPREALTDKLRARDPKQKGQVGTVGLLGNHFRVISAFMRLEEPKTQPQFYFLFYSLYKKKLFSSNGVRKKQFTKHKKRC